MNLINYNNPWDKSLNKKKKQFCFSFDYKSILKAGKIKKNQNKISISFCVLSTNRRYSFGPFNKYYSWWISNILWIVTVIYFWKNNNFIFCEKLMETYKNIKSKLWCNTQTMLKTKKKKRQTFIWWHFLFWLHCICVLVSCR